MKIVMCTLVQKWVYGGKEVETCQLCPFGMKEFASKLMSQVKCKNFNVLPVPVKEMLQQNNISQDYKKDQMMLSDSLVPTWTLS